MKNLLFLIILFGFFSCTESTPNTENTTTTKDSIYEPTHNEYESEKTKNPITIRETSSTNEPFDTTVIVNINDIDIVLNGEKSIFYSDSEYEDYNVIQSNDTIYLSEWMSSGLNFVKVANQNENTYQVQQAYMTSMYILDDGKVFELENWKHHHSKWMNCWMTTKRTNTHGYSEFDNLNFPEYSQTELMEAVENCFYYSEDRMKSYKQLLSNPKYAKQMLHTFISSTIFKITDLEKDKTVYVVLKHYYGC